MNKTFSSMFTSWSHYNHNTIIDFPRIMVCAKTKYYLMRSFEWHWEDMTAHCSCIMWYWYRVQLEEFRSEIQRRDQEIVAMSAKMKTLEEQHTDYQRHIGVLKESLSAKEEHYTMLQADVSAIKSISHLGYFPSAY